MAMHPCLCVPELITTICSALNTSRDSRTLVALATTCKLFAEPALDKLYSQPRSFAHLFWCLPQDLWTVEVTDSHPDLGVLESVLHFKRAMLPSDWLIIKNYARRVQNLKISLADNVLVGHDVLGAIASYCDCDSVFLPRLRSLHIYDPPQAMKPALSLLFKLCIGPLLGELKLERLNANLFHVIILASNASPALHTLSIVSPKNLSNELPALLSGAAAKLRHLKELAIPFPNIASAPNASLFSAIGKFVSLESLSVVIQNPQAHSRQRRPGIVSLPTVILPKLRHIDLTGHPTDIAAVFSCFQNRDSLVSIRLGCSGDLEATDMSQALTELTSALPDRFRTMEFSFAKREKLLSLQPLLKFRNLRNLTVSSNSHFPDQELAALEFPHLLRLYLHGRGPLRRNPAFMPTLRGVGLLLRNCPSLKHLTLAVNALVAANQLCDASPVDVCCTTLTSWNLDTSLIDDAEFVARHITSMMPCVRTLTCIEMGLDKPWKKVETLLAFWRSVSQRHQKALQDA
ncbi:hypothetical protein CONPUDRAFT_144949 [Coniophora puteana RWD-64-598 SS2]|uniref:F-box domain-containing protein n=1 Tax=Coniophora puteana (strain RWD-64-598) TaxID=741705 RepID=A0A5M3MMH9_CONPW|nr:uncharacterized protein CONPUDRAFT_144949 [Coniophora puteana RWD-64-598 SS2]EIW79801.1 hypothetical protein CONPUDRAFT_144949 [Coniophora puteana RWD-64-598 SS2]